MVQANSSKRPESISSTVTNTKLCQRFSSWNVEMNRRASVVGPAQASELIRVLAEPKLNKLFRRLKSRLPEIRVGRSRTFPKSWFTELPNHELGVCLLFLLRRFWLRLEAWLVRFPGHSRSAIRISIVEIFV